MLPTLPVPGTRVRAALRSAPGQVAFTTPARGLHATSAQGLAPWTPGRAVNGYSRLNGSFVNVALRILPIDAATPTHAALGWHPRTRAEVRAHRRSPCRPTDKHAPPN